ncbi:MAG: protein TolR [Sneathiella sp.]|jgi:biopolymer transport protein TolR|uniref:protein TolR n=1 Tax=Sneathiella sp. TaxID=1964365 RepID=UPI000C5651F5|nr:protein TolR [Sneathiella sp.]MAL78080.1 protein TolR [Sneathiella sp.]HCY56263.1 protein TolR [Oceanicaulis sp.]|tara:strand:+ start:40 stop:513 length:474 start_codon:yes stop_codon:yes gene_type:complete
MDSNHYKAFTGKGRRRRHTQMSEINVTPFVDVMLVLLIVFMVTAPLLTVGVPLDLPTTKAETVQGNDEPLVISVNAEGRVFLEDTEVLLEDLVPKLRAVTGAKQDQRIFVRGDTNVNYGRVLAVMGEIHEGGFNRVAMISAGPGRAPASGNSQNSNE